MTNDRLVFDVIDLDGMYLLPGLWDVHIHPDYLAGVRAVDQTIAFGHRLMEALMEAGVVGVRCAGAAHFMDVAWKRAFDAGQYVGPRVFAAGHFLTTTGGIMGPPWDRHWHSFLLDDELEAAFAICRARGFPVMAHATNPAAVKAAIRLGAQSVEHGYMMDACSRRVASSLTIARARDRSISRAS